MADFNEKFNDFNNTKDTSAEYDPQDIQSNKAMAILAYISWLVLIPLFAAKGSKFARFHCNQGLILAIVEVASGIGLGILSMIPFVGWLFTITECLVEGVCIFFAVLGIINASKGKAKELPIIGSIRILK